MSTLQGQVLIAGNVSGDILSLEAPLSLWDGLNSESGVIIQDGHPNQGQTIANKILIFAKGLSGATAGAALTDTARTGSAPLAIIIPKVDEIIVTAAVTAGVLYHKEIPVIKLYQESIDQLPKTGGLSVTDGLINY